MFLFCARGIIVTRHIQNAVVLAAKLGLSSSSVGGVTSYTNTQIGGGTGYYINLGGIKLCWGETGTFTGAGASRSVSLPTGFFSSIQSAMLDIASSTYGDSTIRRTTTTNNLITGWLSTTSATTSLTWFVIGT